MMNTETERTENADYEQEVVQTTYLSPVFDNLPPPKLAFGNWGYRSLFEWKTPDEEGPRSKWKNFQHYKCVGTTSGLGGVNVSATGYGRYPNDQYYSGNVTVPFCFSSSTYGAPGITNIGLPEFYTNSLDGRFIPLPDKLEEVERDAYRAMAPYIQPKLSLVNSLIELKDFRSVGRSLGMWRSFLQSAACKRSRMWKKPLRLMPLAIADSYLQGMFNFRPLISDVCDIYHALSRSERMMNSLMSRAGRRQRAHFTRVLLEFDNELHENPQPEEVGTLAEPNWFCVENSGYPIGFRRRTVRSVIYEPSVFHAELEFSFRFSEFQVEHARLLGLLDQLGLNLNPAVIWNAIPWSFVVDWVVGVSQYLNDQRIGNMDPLVDIHRYLWSIKRKRVITVRSLINFYTGRNTLGATQVVNLPVVTESAFRRVVTTPRTDWLRASGLSLVEGSLASALVVSRRRRRRPRHKSG